MSSVTTSVTNGVAILTLDNPPVNMGNAALRTALADALDSLAGRNDIRGVVLVSAGQHFYAGSDISEFDRPLVHPQLPAVIERIEKLPVPVVAALTGMTLGGGLELALGCDARIGDTSAVLGFPKSRSVYCRALVARFESRGSPGCPPPLILLPPLGR